jgi:hypothetical protein
MLLPAQMFVCIWPSRIRPRRPRIEERACVYRSAPFCDHASLNFVAILKIFQLQESQAVPLLLLNRVIDQMPLPFPIHKGTFSSSSQSIFG